MIKRKESIEKGDGKKAAFRMRKRRKQMNRDLTVGEPQSVLWRFSIPMFVSVIFQQLYNMADSVIAGKFAGEDALAAV